MTALLVNNAGASCDNDILISLCSPRDRSIGARMQEPVTFGFIRPRGERLIDEAKGVPAVLSSLP